MNKITTIKCRCQSFGPWMGKYHDVSFLFVVDGLDILYVVTKEINHGFATNGRIYCFPHEYMVYCYDLLNNKWHKLPPNHQLQSHLGWLYEYQYMPILFPGSWRCGP